MPELNYYDIQKIARDLFKDFADLAFTDRERAKTSLISWIQGALGEVYSRGMAEGEARAAKASGAAALLEVASSSAGLAAAIETAQAVAKEHRAAPSPAPERVTRNTGRGEVDFSAWNV